MNPKVQPEVSDMLAVRELSKSFGTKPRVDVLKSLSLEIARGSFVVLLGPSGCGKTTLLRILAGLEDATSGAISIFGTPVVDTARRLDVPPQRRDIGMVFQNYALWPHMKIKDIVAYPLRMRGVAKETALAQAADILEMLHCGHLADRLPAQLSGGQQQRVALGRALTGDPRLILFDEPLSNVDAQLRREVRAELRRIHARIGFTGIYVTHDLTEGLELADTIVIMNEGRIEQVGSPRDVFDHPSSTWVADFMGIENKIPITVSAGGVEGSFGRVPASGGFRGMADGAYLLYLRRSSLDILPDGTAKADNRTMAFGGCEVRDVVFSGTECDVELASSGERVLATVPTERYSHLQPGDRVDIIFNVDEPLVYPIERELQPNDA